MDCAEYISAKEEGKGTTFKTNCLINEVSMKNIENDSLSEWQQTLLVRLHVMFNLEKPERIVKMISKEEKQNIGK